MVQLQSRQINSLQREITELKIANPAGSEKSMSEFAFKLDMQLSKLLETYLERYEVEHNKRLAAFMAGR